MSSIESLKAFLKENKERDEALGRGLAKEEKIRQRFTAIRELFTNIQDLLKSSVDEGIVESRSRLTAGRDHSQLTNLAGGFAPDRSGLGRHRSCLDAKRHASWNCRKPSRVTGT
jgi:hypothetical protein